MDPIVIASIAELLKMGVMYLMNQAKQAGLNEEQINAAFDAARLRLKTQDPSRIPD